MLSKAPSIGWMCSLQRRWAAWADVLVGSHPGATGVDFLLPIQRVDRAMFHTTKGGGFNRFIRTRVAISWALHTPSF